MAGLAAAFGSGAMTNTIACIEKADVILITGSNTTENHPVIASMIKKEVITNGKRIYANQQDLNEIELFETVVFSKYQQLNEERREIISEAVKNGSFYQL